MTEEGRREAFTKFMLLANSWQQLRLLVDVINCWPPTRPRLVSLLQLNQIKKLLFQDLLSASFEMLYYDYDSICSILI